MLALAIGCWLVGMVLAQYLRIFALVPLALASCVLAALIGAAQGHSIQSIILACILIVVCLQLGFLLGAWIAVPGADRSRLPIRKLTSKKSRVMQPDRAGRQEGTRPSNAGAGPE